VSRPPILVVAGPTGPGKSALGLAVAEALGGEIVSADAFAVYRGMDIGTDKPSPAARRRVRHHLIDVADPRETFSAGDFARAADEAIAAIRSRARVPVVVGGTHFYIRALLLGLFPGPARDPATRARLAREWERDPGRLWRRLESVDPETAGRLQPADRQRILRALEVWELSGVPLSEHWRRHRRPPRYTALIVAPRRERADLYVRIEKRVDLMFSSGFVEEVRGLLEEGVEPESHAMKAIGYREVVGYLSGKCSLAEAVESTKRASRRFAKRQLTWLRHLSEGPVVWVPPLEDGGLEIVARLWSRHIKEGEES